MAYPTRRARAASTGTSTHTDRNPTSQSNGSRNRRSQWNRPGTSTPRRSSRKTGPRRPVSVPETPATALERALDAAAKAPAATTLTTFADAGLPDPLVAELRRRGITEPFAIQARALPDGLAGRDILGRAQTGSGKTLGFGLPMLARLVATRDDRRPGAPRGLVLVPTRELAQQVTDVLAPLGRSVGLRLAAVYGGASMGRQITELRRGVDVVVATPGRLLDLNRQGECDLSRVGVCVLDEADYMADLGFLPDVTRLLDMTPPDAQRMLFSATLDRGVDKVVDRYLTEPALHAVAAAAAPIESVEHRVFTVRPDHKVLVAAEIAGRPGRTLIFVRTKHGADRLVRQLKSSGVHAAAIHGNRNQGQRTRALHGFSAGSPRVLVATDVAARGIHVDAVDLIVHFDLPGDHKDYLHRSGRTARAGASGTVVSLAMAEQRRELARLHQLARVTASVVDVEPGAAAVREVATSGEPVVVRAADTPEVRSERRESRPGQRERSGAGAGRRRSDRAAPGYRGGPRSRRRS